MTQVAQQTWNRDLWGIVNAQGKPWTYRVWGSEKEAQAYLTEHNGFAMDLSKHRAKKISITVRAIADKK